MISFLYILAFGNLHINDFLLSPLFLFLNVTFKVEDWRKVGDRISTAPAMQLH